MTITCLDTGGADLKITEDFFYSVEYISTRYAYQGCEKVMIVLSHHAHEQDLQKRNKR